MTAEVIEIHPKSQNEIVQFFHCKRCGENIPPGISPSDHQEIEVGWTKIGFQVWCKRHDLNIVHIDFEGHKHPVCSG